MTSEGSIIYWNPLPNLHNGVGISTVCLVKAALVDWAPFNMGFGGKEDQKSSEVSGNLWFSK